VILVSLAGALGLGWYLGRRSEPVTTAAPSKALYRCAMHPQIVSDRPGRCPICNMALVPVDDVRPKLTGARTAVVADAPFVRTIRTVGRVAFDETRMRHIHTKVQGWIEHLHAGAEGDTVRRGDALLTLYAPELLASQQEYLVALDNRARASASSIPGVAEDAERLVDSARRRLLIFDMTEEQIETLARTRKVDRVVTLYSPVTGTITARRVSHGERVESATSLLDIADLTSVWVLAELYESDLAFVHDGQEVVVRAPALPGRTFRAKISLLSPLVDPRSRTVSARIELDNRDLALRPGMFAEATLASDLGVRRSIPKDAVLRTGERDVVLVAQADGSFEPKDVVLGIELPDRWEVVSGLDAGDRVVVGASFFLDAESKLRR
jgi:RND family efflux transporter MFP subunit